MSIRKSGNTHRRERRQAHVASVTPIALAVAIDATPPASESVDEDDAPIVYATAWISAGLQAWWRERMHPAGRSGPEGGFPDPLLDFDEYDHQEHRDDRFQRPDGAPADDCLGDAAIAPVRSGRRRPTRAAAWPRGDVPGESRNWRGAGRASSSRMTPALVSARACRHGVTTVRMAPRSRDGSQGGSYIHRLADRVERAAVAVLRLLRVLLRDLGAASARPYCCLDRPRR
jgi:hypothetical protein